MLSTVRCTWPIQWYKVSYTRFSSCQRYVSFSGTSTKICLVSEIICHSKARKFVKQANGLFLLRNFWYANLFYWAYGFLVRGQMNPWQMAGQMDGGLLVTMADIHKGGANGIEEMRQGFYGLVGLGKNLGEEESREQVQTKQDT